MRRISDLMDRILCRENLENAWYKASKGKRDRYEVRGVFGQLDQLESRFREWIGNGEIMKLFSYRRFVIRDPKERVIHAAPFLTRVFHHAIINVIGPYLEMGAIDQSFACRKGLGNLKALEAARTNTRKCRAYLKMDIRKYFDSVDQRILSQRLDRKFKDVELLEILNGIICSYHTTRGRGLPIGTLTSQYFANFYLDPMDRFIKESLGCRMYVRFMDDFILWHDDRETLEIWKTDITRWLGENLHLDVKMDSGTGWCAQGVPFLGYRAKPDALLLAKRSKKRFRRKFTQLENQYFNGDISEQELSHRAASLFAFTKHASSKDWRQNLVESSLGRHLY